VPTAFPVQVFPSYHIDTGAPPYVGVCPTAHPVDPLERYTPSRDMGFTIGKTDGALVQLKDPPFHLKIEGASVKGSGVPTAQPSESLTMKTESSCKVFGEVVVLQIASD